MTDADFYTIKSIIDNDLDINHLIRIKEMVDIKIKKYNEDVLKDNTTILTKNLKKFIEEKIPGDIRKTLKIKLFLGAISNITGFEIEELLVADIIGFNIDEISINRYYCGEKTISAIEELLNKYDLSMKFILDGETKQQIEDYRENLPPIIKKYHKSRRN